MFTNESCLNFYYNFILSEQPKEFNNYLPFGGSNNSGIGKGHGFAGFEAFSNGRGILKQVTPFTALDLLTAPYNALKQKLIDISIKFF